MRKWDVCLEKQISFEGRRILSPFGTTEESRRDTIACEMLPGEKSADYASGRASRILSLTNDLDIDGLTVTFSDSLMLHT